MKRLINRDLEIINKNFKGNIYIDGKFSNSEKKEGNNLWKVLKWKLSSNPQSEEKKEAYQPRVVKDYSFLTDKNDVLIWLGHSCFYIRTDGVTF